MLALGCGAAAAAAEPAAARRACARRAAVRAAAKKGGFGAAKTKVGPEPCPCGASDAPYKKCCAPYHEGKAFPPTAEKLMRSRYTAFVKKKIKYLVATTHPLHPTYNGMRLDSGEVQSTLAEDLKATADTAIFLGLEILETSGGGESDDEGEVYFESKFTIGRQRGFRQRGKKDAPQSIRERSKFIRMPPAEGEEKGKWIYREGTPEGEGYTRYD